MSNPPKTWLADANYNKFKGSYLQGDVDCSGGDIIIRNGNLYMPADSSIYSPNNRIFFNEQYLYTNFASNVHIYGTFQLDRTGTTYDVGYEIADVIKPTLATNTTNITSNTTNIATNASNIASNTSAITTLGNKTTNLSYNAGTTTFDLSNNAILTLAPTSIPSTAINNTSFIALTGDQSGILGIKGFSNNVNCSASIQITSTAATQGLRLDGVLRLNAGALTITQATLQKLQYLSTVSSDVQTQINNINTSALLSTANTWSQIQSFTLAPVMSGASISALSIPNSALATTYIDNSSAQSIGGIKTFSSPPVMSGSSIAAASIPNSALATTYIDNSTAQSIGGIKTFSSPPVMSGSSIAAASIPDSALVSSGFVNLTTAQTVAGIKNFSSPPIMSGASITASTIPNSALATTYIDNSSAQTVAGIKTFSSPPVMSGASITASTVPSTAISNTTFVSLTGNQSIAGVKTFTSAPVLNGGSIAQASIPTSAINNLSFPTFLGANIFNALNTFSNNIRLDGSLILSAGTITIANSVLQYLNGLTSNLQTQLNAITTNITSLFSYQPPGTIIMSLVYVPSPFFICNGAALSRTTYSALFTAIGTTYGAGDGSSTFNIPNYAGMFLRCQGSQVINGITYSSEATIATFQADALQDHNHNGQSGQYLGSTNTSVGTNGYASVAIQRPSVNNFAITGGINSGAAFRLAPETRPANYGVFYYIKCL